MPRLSKDDALRLGRAIRRGVDIEPLFWDKVFAPLHDLDRFRQIPIDKGGGSVFWSTGDDLAPQLLFCRKETPHDRVRSARPEEAVSAASELR